MNVPKEMPIPTTEEPIAISVALSRPRLNDTNEQKKYLYAHEIILIKLTLYSFLSE